MLTKVPLTKRMTAWRLPSVDFDPFVADTNATIAESAIEDMFHRFGVEVAVEQVLIGAHVTTYALRPLGKTKIKSIASCVGDVSLHLCAPGMRFIKSVGATGCVGLEVPSSSRTFPTLSNFPRIVPGVDNTGIPVALGYDSTNKCHEMYLDSCPHTLVAGTTGSGKSVFLNSILCSIMSCQTPRQVGLILIDPKQVEFNPYQGIPFLRAPVITDMKNSFQAITDLVEEMESRYALLKSSGCQNYDEFVRRNRSAMSVPERIVCMIDEFADLILTNKEVEEPIVRLAQKGRAAGIHLVIATQRPVVKVVTGLIKANVPVRVAFRVASNLESRIILDQGGAEFLTGKGDMIVVHPEIHAPVRLQAPWVSPEHVASLTAHWRSQTFWRNALYGEAA